MSLQPRKPLKDLLSLSFNQDAGCFSCGLTTGFRVFTSEPFTESYRRDFDSSGGVAVAEMLFRSNILALVGGGPVPKYPPNKVIIWDDHQGRAVGELQFKNPVKSVCLRRDRIAVALEHKVFLYDLEDLRLLHTIETAPNPEGLLALSPSEQTIVLACPGLHLGQVRLDVFHAKRIKIIDAHHSPLSALALCNNGKLVATASEKGTLIRIFSTNDGTKLREVRRGSDPAKIFSIAFSRCIDDLLPEWLAVTSDKGTAHIFNLTGKKSSNDGNHTHDTNVGGEGVIMKHGNINGKNTNDVKTSEQQVGVIGEGNTAATTIVTTTPAMVKPTSHSSRLTMHSISSSLFSKLVPNRVGGSYLASERSWAQYRLPDTNKCSVAFGKEEATVIVASVTGALHRVVFDPDKKGPCEQLSYALFMEDND